MRRKLRVVSANCSNWVKWPPASTREWQEFDDDVDGILEATMKGGANRKLQIMATMIISIATERLGSVEKCCATSQYSKNCRAEKISQERSFLIHLTGEIFSETGTSTFEEAVQGGKRGHVARSGRTMWHPQEEAADPPPSRVAQEAA